MADGVIYFCLSSIIIILYFIGYIIIFKNKSYINVELRLSTSTRKLFADTMRVRIEFISINENSTLWIYLPG